MGLGTIAIQSETITQMPRASLLLHDVGDVSDLFHPRRKPVRVELQWGPARPLQVAQAVSTAEPMGKTLSVAAVVTPSTSSSWDE